MRAPTRVVPRPPTRTLGRASGLWIATPLLAVTAVAAPGHLGAQSTPASAQRDELAGRYAGTQELLGQAPAGVALPGTATRAFLTADNGNTVAQISTGFTVPRTSPLTFGVRLTGKTPLTKGADDATLTDYRKLGDGTQLDLALQGTYWGAPARASDISAWCTAVQARTPNPLPDVKCDSFNQTDAEKAGPTIYREFLARAKWTEPVVFELTAGAGRNNRRFLNATTFAPDSQDRVGYAFGANVGRSFSFFPHLRAAFLSVGYQYQVTYKPRDSAQVCVPAASATPGALQCRSGPLGAPKEKKDNVVSAELRGFFSERFGVAPSAAYLATSRAWEFGVPIYFAPDKAHRLIGGFGPSYSTEDKLGARIFVGAAAFGLGK